MNKFFLLIITKLSFKLLFGLLQLHFFYNYIQSIVFNKSIINNIIFFKEENFRYLSFATYSNGDMIFSSTAFPQNKTRIFYGFKKNGRPFFQNEESYFYSKSLTNNWKEKFESDILPIKLSDGSEKEYLISTGNKESFVEIYDFENNNIYTKSMTNFTKYYVESFRNMGIFLSSNNKDYYYLFGYTINENNILKYSVQIHKFNEIQNFYSYQTCQNEEKIDNVNNKRDGISCFITNNKIIICFYLTKSSYISHVNYNIIALEINLQQKGSISTFSDYNNDNPFYRCIHLKEEVGVFSYYYRNSYGIYYPILLFKQFSNNQITDFTIPKIYLNYEQFITSLLTNDLIKLKEDKICFSSILKNKTTIYIILINLFDDTRYKVRYYSINLYNIYNYKIFFDIRTHNYNNFIAFAFSFCKNSIACNADENEHFAALMLFSYPNSTDSSSDLYEFLINNYNSTINDFNVNLENQVRIENNIFGYVFDRILI